MILIVDQGIGIDQKIITNLATEIVDRGMSVPAIFFLESTKYLSFIGSQFLVFLGPIATCFINNKKYHNFAEILEKKANIDLDRKVLSDLAIHNADSFKVLTRTARSQLDVA